MKRLTFVIAAALLSLAAQRHSFAGSATWSSNPSSGDWTTAANWVPNTVPNGTSNVATLGTSNVTDVINTNVIVNLDSLVFNSGAPQYTLTVISNTSANPISGTFAKLPDGGIVTINGNNFQASYSGGNGNDLTLKVVP
jgi:hypothetical protein